MLVGWLVLVSPVGRMTVSAVGARVLLARVVPGTYPRGGRVHLRLWLAERLADETGAVNQSGAPWMQHYARALGAEVGDGRRPALGAAGDRASSGWATAARSSPRWT